MGALTDTRTPPPFLFARLRATHTHKHTHAVPSAWGVDTNCKPPLCGSASLCHQPLSFSKLPVGKTHNFYTTEPGLAVAGIAVSLKCFLLGHLQAVLITRSLRGALLCPSLCLFVLCKESVQKGIRWPFYTKKEEGGKEVWGTPHHDFPCSLLWTAAHWKELRMAASLALGRPMSQQHGSLS